MMSDVLERPPVIEPVIGRYIHLDIAGRKHRVYYEEAGTGIPLLCLHTAGADARQYRAVLNDPETLKKFRVIAFDLPWHGKSSPPDGWQNETYKLTTDSYMETILAFIGALGLEKPVVMGCSIGGRAVLHLAIRHGAKFRAGIGLESHAGYDPRMHPLIADLEYLQRPDVNGQEAAAATVSGLVSPLSPEEGKWETLWHYMQGGPGAFAGDLYYYMVDGDLRNGLLSKLDTKICPLYLLTGDYDYSATVERTMDVVRQVPGAQFSLMPGLGHFPMSENPDLFLTYLHPVLEKIAAS
jgi:pimeloyl-ACP methyl ester carboxylesterase